MSRFYSFVALASLVTAVGALAACTKEEDDPGPSTSALSEPFNRNNVLTNVELMDPEAYSAEQIQRFLEQTPYKNTSVLAAYEVAGVSASQILFDAAQTYGVNPLELIVRLQMEQSLISKTTADAKTLSLAFGCGCPHAPVCSTTPALYTGFKLQAECSARTLKASMDRLLNATPTISGWKKGLAKTTEDGIVVTPLNEATAALYSYTPWIGETGGGKIGVGGQSLHRTIWVRFDKALRGEYDTDVDGGAATTDSGSIQGDAGKTDSGGYNECTNDNACASKGFVCDTSLRKCVQCTSTNATKCANSTSGFVCLANQTCGCKTDTSCGGLTSGRICSATTAKCESGCRFSGGNSCPTGQSCNIQAGDEIGTCAGAAVDAGSAAKDGGATADAGPLDIETAEEDPSGHVTPSETPPPPVGKPGSQNFNSGTGEEVNIGNGADRKKTVSACSSTPASSGSSPIALVGVGLALAAALARRKKA